MSRRHRSHAAMLLPGVVLVGAMWTRMSAAAAETNQMPAESLRHFSRQDPSKDAARPGYAGRSSRRTDHFRIGALGGVGFPRPLAIEGMVLLEKTVGLGVEYSLLPKMTLSGVETSFWAVAADARVFPFHGGFFLGLRAGHQHLGGQATFTAPPFGSVTESMAVDTTFVNPRVGFLWMWEPGFTIGLDAGAQIPVGVTASNSLPPGITLNQEVESVSRSFGKNTIPTVDLLRIGFLL